MEGQQTAENPAPEGMHAMAWVVENGRDKLVKCGMHTEGWPLVSFVPNLPDLEYVMNLHIAQRPVLLQILKASLFATRGFIVKCMFWIQHVCPVKFDLSGLLTLIVSCSGT